jgi:hypothetical protein
MIHTKELAPNPQSRIVNIDTRFQKVIEVFSLSMLRKERKNQNCLVFKVLMLVQATMTHQWTWFKNQQWEIQIDSQSKQALESSII